ncbi:hypothetical protein AN403_993 [Pseudomonas fluorescens]|uniref:Uncharacterized protein n=1 Tax=Pseudomonas fluorescens TaxID=294 RepID=A0A0P8WM55_PSEFL|nr:hypothetical protein AN403_993 [Pseudomonas fluorescens]
MVFGGFQCNASIETGRYAVLAKFGILDSKRAYGERFRIKLMPLIPVTFDLLSVQGTKRCERHRREVEDHSSPLPTSRSSNAERTASTTRSAR